MSPPYDLQPNVKKPHKCGLKFVRLDKQSSGLMCHIQMKWIPFMYSSHNPFNVFLFVSNLNVYSHSQWTHLRKGKPWRVTQELRGPGTLKNGASQTNPSVQSASKASRTQFSLSLSDWSSQQQDGCSLCGSSLLRLPRRSLVRSRREPRAVRRHAEQLSGSQPLR